MATRWRPDTCKCILVVNDWDTDDAITEQACAHHEGLSGKAHMQVVYRGEVQVKSFALGEIELLEPGSTEDAIVRFIGNPTIPTRHCELTLPRLQPGRRTAALARVNARVGAGKVTVK